MKKLAFVLGLLVVLFASAEAYIQTQDCGNVISWPNSAWSSGLSYVIASNDTAGNSVSDASKLALRESFRAWEDAAGSEVNFTENTSSSQQARTDWEATNIHLVLFDPENDSGFLTSGVVAVTPISFTVSGGSCPSSNGSNVVDADILVGSGSFTFSTQATGVGGQTDLQNVITHEVGHFIGLDHSAVGAATMFPFVDFAEIAKRSLSTDDIAAAAVIRPPSSTSTGTISGTILKNDGSTAVSRPHVVALDTNGNVASAIYGGTDGTFTLTGLAAGNYTVYAAPYTGPVRTVDINDSATISTDFSMTFYGGNSTPTSISVSASSNTAAGNLTCNAAFGAGFTGPRADPFLVTKGSATVVTLTGSGFTGLTFEVSNPGSADVSISGASVGATSASFTATATSNAAVGMRDVRLISGTNKIVYTGILEVVEAAPIVTSLDVTGGSASGGTEVVITGTGFLGDTSTIRVIIGDQLATVSSVSSTSLTVTTPANDAGTVDVGVINPDGQGGLLADAFSYDPVISSVSNRNLCASRVNNLTINGAGFLSGATVTIGTTEATNVAVVNSGKITCKTPILDVGSYDLTVTNTDMGTTTLSSYLNYTTSCGGGGGGCFSIDTSHSAGPGDHLGLLLPYLLLLIAIVLLRKKSESLR